MGKTVDKPANLNLSALALADSDPIVREGGPGRGLSPETEQAVEWLQASHQEGDGVKGKPKKIVVQAGATEYVISILRRAAAHLNVGLDTQAVNVKGNKVEVRFATRPKRERRASEPDAED